MFWVKRGKKSYICTCSCKQEGMTGSWSEASWIRKILSETFFSFMYRLERAHGLQNNRGSSFLHWLTPEHFPMEDPLEVLSWFFSRLYLHMFENKKNKGYKILHLVLNQHWKGPLFWRQGGESGKGKEDCSIIQRSHQWDVCHGII